MISLSPPLLTRKNAVENRLGTGRIGRTFPFGFLVVLICLPGILSPRLGSASQFESPELTPKGEFLLELNGTVEREENSTEKDTTYVFPQPTPYIGALPNFEFQLESNGVVVTAPDGGESETSGADFLIKGKVGLTQANGWIHQSAVFAVITFPMGGNAVTSDGVDPSISYLATWRLPHDMAFTLNVGIGTPTNRSDKSNRYFEFSSVFKLKFAIIGELEGLVEYFNAIGNESRPDQHSMDAGLSYQLAENLAWSLRAGPAWWKPLPTISSASN